MEGIKDIAVQHTKAEIRGTCSDPFTPVREAFAHNLDTGQLLAGATSGGPHTSRSRGWAEELS